MFMHAMPLGRLAESRGWKPSDLARSLGVRYRRGESCGDVIEQAIYKGEDPMWLEEFIKQTGSPAGHGNVRRPKRSSRSSRSSRRGGKRHGNAQSAQGPEFFDRPLASSPFKSYRYRGDYGWIMIGAMNETDALRQAERSLSSGAKARSGRLEAWNGQRYVAVRRKR